MAIKKRLEHRVPAVFVFTEKTWAPLRRLESVAEQRVVAWRALEQG